MTTVFKDIRQKIMDVIDADASLIESVYRSDRSNFDGYPAATVSPSDNEADYGDQAMDKNIITFIVRVFQQIPEAGQEDAELSLENAVEELITIFQDKDALSPVADWVQPVPSIWGYQDRETGPVRVVELRIRCRKYINQ